MATVGLSQMDRVRNQTVPNLRIAELEALVAKLSTQLDLEKQSTELAKREANEYRAERDAARAGGKKQLTPLPVASTKELEARISGLESALDDRTDQLAQLREERDQLHGKLTEVEETQDASKQLRNKVSALELKLQRASDELGTVKAERDQFEGLLGEATASVSNLQDALDQAKKTAAWNDEKESALSAALRSLASATEELARLQAEVAELTEANKKAERELTEAQLALGDRTTELDLALGDLRKANSSLVEAKQLAEEANGLVRSLGTEKAGLEERIRTAETELVELRERSVKPEPNGDITKTKATGASSPETRAKTPANALQDRPRNRDGSIRWW